MNQSNYFDKVIGVVAMITSFGSDVGNGGNKTTNDIDVITLIHLADCSNDCSKHNDGRSINSFESTTNDRRTSNDSVSNTDAPNAASDLEMTTLMMRCHYW